MIDEADRDHDKQISFEDFSDILVWSSRTYDVLESDFI
jgi:hypothetical protein